MQWIEREPSYEFPYPTYFSSRPCLIDGRHYYCFYTVYDARCTGWILSNPHSRVESFIDTTTPQEAEEFCQWFFESLGGCDNEVAGSSAG